MSDLDQDKQIRVSKTEAKAATKRLRQLLSSELAWNGTPKQASILAAKILGWKDLTAMEANYLSDRVSKHSPLAPLPLPEQFRSILHGATWRTIEVYETINHTVPFSYLKDRQIRHNERRVEDDLVDEIEDWLIPNPALAKFVLDAITPDDISLEPASFRAAKALAGQAACLAKSLWLFRTGYMRADFDIDDAIVKAVGRATIKKIVPYKSRGFGDRVIDLDDDEEGDPDICSLVLHDEWLSSACVDLLVRQALGNRATDGSRVPEKLPEEAIAAAEAHLENLLSSKCGIIRTFRDDNSRDRSDTKLDQPFDAGKATKTIINRSTERAQEVMASYGLYLEHLNGGDASV